MTDIQGVFWVKITIHTQKGAFAPYLVKILKYMKNSHIPPGYTQILSKMPFFPIKELMFQKIVLRRKDLTLIYICGIIFSQKKFYNKSYI